MPLSKSRQDHVLLLAVALSLALAFTVALLAYYRAFHFGVGTAYGAIVVGLPAAFLLALLTGYSIRWRQRRDGTPVLASRMWIIAAMVASLALLFLAEWMRTSDGRARDRMASIVQSLRLTSEQRC